MLCLPIEIEHQFYYHDTLVYPDNIRDFCRKEILVSDYDVGYNCIYQDTLYFKNQEDKILFKLKYNV